MLDTLRASPGLWFGVATIVGAVVLHQVLSHAKPCHGNNALKISKSTGNSELDNHFDHAAKYVARYSKSSKSNEEKLVLYAFYKQALNGDCTDSKPSLVEFVAKAKWDAWSALRGMSMIEAKKRYLETVSSMYPSYKYGTDIADTTEHSSGSESDGGGINLTPLMSQFVVDKTTEEWQVVEDEYHLAKTGQVEALEQYLTANINSIDKKDNTGRTMLHWAVDRNQELAVEKLLLRGAQVNATDSDGMTPLHYAISCEHIPLINMLLKHGADTLLEDLDGETPIASATSVIRTHVTEYLQQLDSETK